MYFNELLVSDLLLFSTYLSLKNIIGQEGKGGTIKSIKMTSRLLAVYIYHEMSATVVSEGCFPVGDLAEAVRKRTNVTFGLYFSLYEWFNPLYLKDKTNHFKTQQYVNVSTSTSLLRWGPVVLLFTCIYLIIGGRLQFVTLGHYGPSTV